jgi:hypothetical protein
MSTPTDPNAFLDLSALHAAIVSDIQTQYPTLANVEFYRTEERKSIPIPSILLTLEEFEGEPDLDVGTGQLAVTARFSAQIIMGFKTPNVKLAIRLFASAFAAWLYLRRWTGIVTDAAQVIGAYPDEFDPRLDEYEVWRVEWTQGLYLGNNAWVDTSAPLTSADGTAGPYGAGVMVGTYPEVGTPYVQDYVPLETDPTVISPTTVEQLNDFPPDPFTDQETPE